MAHVSQRGNVYWILGLFPLAATIWLLTQTEAIANGDFLTFVAEWAPTLGVTFSFRIDGLGLLMSLLVLGMGGFVLIYASGYMKGDPQIGRFYAILITFMIAMLGVVTADNIILLFVFWELTSITSFLLIGFKHEYQTSQTSALQALVVTGAGGLCLMAGLILLGIAGQSWELSELLTQGDAIRSHQAYIPIFDSRSTRCVYQIGAIPLPFLVTKCDGGPNTG